MTFMLIVLGYSLSILGLGILIGSAIDACGKSPEDEGN